VCRPSKCGLFSVPRNVSKCRGLRVPCAPFRLDCDRWKGARPPGGNGAVHFVCWFSGAATGKLLKLGPVQIVLRKIGCVAKPISLPGPALPLCGGDFPASLSGEDSFFLVVSRGEAEASCSSQLWHSGLLEDIQSRHQGQQGLGWLSPRHYNNGHGLQIPTPMMVRSDSFLGALPGGSLRTTLYLASVLSSAASC
jgi:hypothetical protein